MTQVKRLTRWAVLASSVLLVAGFICYQAGAFSWVADARETAAPAPDEPAGERIIGSTKSLSGDTFDFTVEVVGQDEKKPAEPVLWSSSKYIVIKPPPPTASPAESKPTAKKPEK